MRINCRGWWEMGVREVSDGATVTAVIIALPGVGRGRESLASMTHDTVVVYVTFPPL